MSETDCRTTCDLVAELERLLQGHCLRERGRLVHRFELLFEPLTLDEGELRVLRELADPARYAEIDALRGKLSAHSYGLCMALVAAGRGAGAVVPGTRTDFGLVPATPGCEL